MKILSEFAAALYTAFMWFAIICVGTFISITAFRIGLHLADTVSKVVISACFQ